MPLQAAKMGTDECSFHDTMIMAHKLRSSSQESKNADAFIHLKIFKDSQCNQTEQRAVASTLSK